MVIENRLPNIDNDDRLLASRDVGQACERKSESLRDAMRHFRSDYCDPGSEMTHRVFHRVTDTFIPHMLRFIHSIDIINKSNNINNLPRCSGGKKRNNFERNFISQSTRYHQSPGK